MYKKNGEGQSQLNKKSDIMPAAQEFAWNNADHEECYGQYHGFVKIQDREFDSYEEAEDYLCSLRNDGAVKFREYDEHKNFMMKWMIMVSH